MRFHDYCDNDSVLHSRLNTEITWENFINHRKTPTTKEDMAKLLHQLQEYIFFDFPYEKRGLSKNDENIKEIMFAFDNVCRIACMMATDTDIVHSDYFDEKFSNVLHFLALEKNEY